MCRRMSQGLYARNGWRGPLIRRLVQCYEPLLYSARRGGDGGLAIDVRRSRVEFAGLPRLIRDLRVVFVGVETGVKTHRTHAMNPIDRNINR